MRKPVDVSTLPERSQLVLALMFREEKQPLFLGQPVEYTIRDLKQKLINNAKTRTQSHESFSR